MMKNYFYILLVFLGLTVLSGCGKEIQVSVKADEKEREQPVVSLVRTIDLSYFAPDGGERFKQSVAVLGLSSPVTFQKEVSENVEIEAGGKFLAQAKSSQGDLLMQGERHVGEEDKDVEILLSRDLVNQAKPIHSAVFKKIKISLQPGTEQDFVVDKSFYEMKEGKKCVELPAITLDSSGWFSPYIKFEAQQGFVAPEIKAIIRDPKGNEVGQVERMSFNAMGEPVFSLNRELLDSYFYKDSREVNVEFYSKEYEGCLKLNTNLNLKDLDVYLEVLASDMAFNRSIPEENLSRLTYHQVHASEYFVIKNPNNSSVQGDVQIWGMNSRNENTLDQVCISGALYLELKCYFYYTYAFKLEANQIEKPSLIGLRSIYTKPGEVFDSAHLENYKLRMSFGDFPLYARVRIFKDGRVFSQKEIKLR